MNSGKTNQTVSGIDSIVTLIILIFVTNEHAKQFYNENDFLKIPPLIFVNDCFMIICLT